MKRFNALLCLDIMLVVLLSSICAITMFLATSEFARPGYELAYADEATMPFTREVISSQPVTVEKTEQNVFIVHTADKTLAIDGFEGYNGTNDAYLITTKPSFAVAAILGGLVFAAGLSCGGCLIRERKERYYFHV